MHLDKTTAVRLAAEIKAKATASLEPLPLPGPRSDKWPPAVQEWYRGLTLADALIVEQTPTPSLAWHLASGEPHVRGLPVYTGARAAATHSASGYCGPMEVDGPGSPAMR